MTAVTILSLLAKKGVKLSVVDGQLKVSAPKGALTGELRQQLVDNKAEILELLISTRSTTQDAAIPHADRDFPLPLSFGQERLWFLNELEPSSSLYNIPTAIRLKGHLNLNALQQAFDKLLVRHESLRTTFTLNGEQPVQKIANSLSIPLEKYDAGDINDNDLNALLTKICLQPFDIKHGPLLKLHVLDINKDENALLLVIHHIIADGWSMGLLMSELAALYNSIVSEGRNTLPALPIQFADYAVWQRETMSGDTLSNELSYWKKALDGAPLVLDLPTDHPRPASPGYEGAWVQRQVSSKTRAKLEALAQNNNASLYMVLLSAFHVLLSRHSGSDELVIGSPVAGRSRTELEGIIGSLINTVALRGDLSDNPQFSALLERVRDTTLNAFEHQDLPFEKLVEELQPERSMSHAPVYQVLFNLQNRSQEVVSFDGLKSSALITETGTAKLDLHLLVEETGTGLTAWFEYATELFDESTIERMAVQFERLLDVIAINPDIVVSQIDLSSAEEQQHLQAVLNASDHDYSRPECLHQLFEQQVNNNPAAAALTCDGESLSYAELNARANQLAHHLVAKGVTADTLIGISMERSLDLVVGILGVLKAGGGYLPLDPNYPEDRLAFMVEDSQTPIIVTHAAAAERVPASDAEIVVLDTLDASLPDSNPDVAVSSSQLAYVIYTSGSTGKPKGVLIEHANVTRLMRATEDWYGFNDQDVWTLFHSYAFDFTVWELWGSLLYGGRLVIVPYFVSRSTEEFYDLLVAEKVTILNQTPSAFSALMRVDETAAKDLSLRYVVFGGEALDLKALKPWFERHGDVKPQLVNMYGITETTVHVTYRPLVLADCDAPSSNIGQPIPDLQVYVLNESRIPVPVGAPGEMYVGGAGLARGYLNRPELTEERFVPHPFDSTPGARLYRTGDLARRRPDGDLEYMGRADDQVKLRGFRIELGEIESALLSHDAVNESIVVLLGETSDDQKLVGYVVPTPNATLEVADLQRHLKESLPDYMVPAAIIELDALPLTANGKVDRKALPKPTFEAAEYVAPESETEISLAEMFCQLLDVPQVGVNDDFFALGGHSLLATRLITRIREQLQGNVELKQLFVTPTIKELGALIDGGSKAAERESIKVIPRDGDLPLSFAQQRLWFLHKLMPESSLYNVPWAMRLEGHLDTAALQRAINKLLARHESLHTRFTEIAGEAMLYLAKDAEIPLNVIDLQLESAAEVKQTVTELSQKVFSLDTAPLMRVHLLRDQEDSQILLFVIHHIIADAWSLGLLFDELMTLYAAECENKDAQLAPLAIQYADYAAWQREHLSGDKLQQQLEYWRANLNDAPAVLELPTDHPRPAVQSYNGKLSTRKLPTELLASLHQLSNEQGTTLFMTMLAAFNIMLSRYSGQDDIVVGTPVAGRPHSELEGVIGFFLNTLPLRSRLGHNPSFRQLLQELRQTTLNAYANQDLPFDQIVEDLQPVRDMSIAPIFQSVFTLQTVAAEQTVYGNVNISDVEVDYGTAKFDITWSVMEKAGELSVQCEYASDLFDETTIQRMLEHYQLLLQDIVSEPSTAIKQLAMLSTGEQRQLRAWNTTGTAFPEDQSLHALFEQQALSNPTATAVEFNDTKLSYQELNERANGLAAQLIALGAGPDQPVAICVNRSLDTLVGLLGILKSGSGYVPLDPIYPPERIAYMLEDSGSKILVSEPELAATLPTDNIHLLNIADCGSDSSNPNLDFNAQQLAYLIYTSGSTGQPKGVEIEHRSVVNFLHSMAGTPGIAASDRLLAVTTLCFDISVLELFLPLTQGAAVVIASQEQAADGHALRGLLETADISIMQATPASWRMLFDAGWNGSTNLKVLVGGEALDRDLAAQLQQQNQSVWNMYGPTETTIWSACHNYQPDDAGISVGRPIANTQLYVLDDSMQLVPAGVPGELYIGGDGVARGYWQREELTAERFINNPHGEGRIYRSGDRVRWLTDGTLEVLGRTDFQVKLRGFRIELGEIESQLNDFPDVTQAVVILREDTPGDQRLIAYTISPDGVTADADALREHLKPLLPEYMVPSAFINLESLPLTPNGKIDRKALPAPDWEDIATAKYVAPRNKTEQKLAELWSQTLGIEQVGVYDDFFALGGHSLLAVKLTSSIRDEMDAEISVLDLFTARDITGLAGLINSRLTTATQEAIPVVTRAGLLPLSFAQQRLWFLDELAPENPMYNVPWMMRIKGSVDIAALETALNEVVARHESLRTIFPNKSGEATQLIKNELHIPLEQLDLRGASEADLQSKLTELAQTPFRLREGPLLRVTLLQTDEDSYALSLIVHHIIFDAWSHGVFLRELAGFYNAALHQQTLQLPALSVEFADYAAWQRSWFGGEDFNLQLNYWKDQLDDAPGVSEIHADRPRPAVQTSNGANAFRFLSDDVHSGLQSIMRTEGCTLFSVLMTAFNVLISRYSGQDDLVIGTPIAGRKRSELEDIIGFFLHTLAIRTDLSGDPQFNELLHRVNDSILNGFEHQELPFETLVEELGVERDTSRSPIFQIMFVLQHVELDWNMFDGLQTEPLNFEFGTAKYDMMFFVFETADGLAARLEYNTDLFDSISMERLLDHFETLLSGIVANPKQTIGQIPLLKDSEQQQLLVEWNQTDFDYPGNETMHSLFEQQAARIPGNNALYFDGEELSYRELNRRANKLAQQLIEKGAGPDVLVGICIERCTEMIIGMLATLKAGAAYVPLDPAYPPQRVSYMLDDCKAPLLLTHSSLIEKLPQGETQSICLDTLDWSVSEEHDRNPLTAVQAHNLGYTIYTSGSTGMPKGVAIEHRNAVALIQWAGQVFTPAEFSGVLASTSICFDLSVFEIFCPLGLGGRIIVIKDALALPDLPDEANVTLINTVPSAIAELVRIKGVPASVNTVNLAGEPLSTTLVDAIYGLGTVERVNDLYGPSEDTTYSTWTLREAGQPPTIGRPIYNTQAYILDSYMNPVPVGVAGELYLGGRGVTRGYLGRPKLTAEKYVANPFSNDAGARLYSTGDQARYRADSNIEFIGRVDHQVKLRGFRIELGEIETVLNSHSAVEQTVVMAREDREGDKRLVAYLVGSTENLEGDELEQWEAEQVDQWKHLWEDAYGRDEAVVDPAFNITGWNSSYDGEPIPAKQMRVWLDSTADRIKALQPHKTLEIGSGTGLVVASVAPGCESYLATDFSDAAVQTVEKLKEHYPELHNVEGLQSSADGIGALEKGGFDTVIINSVAQYFPDIDYLVSVIENAIERIGDQGHIFLGDLRSRPLLSAYHTSVQTFQAADDMPLPELAELILQRTEQEEELLIDPLLFLALKRNNPRITGVRFALKRGAEYNELTRFRYDAILEIDGSQTTAPEPEKLDWASAGINLNELEKRLDKIDSNGLLLTGVPNERLVTERYCMEQLAHPEQSCVADLKVDAANQIGMGIEPEQLYLMAESAGLDLQMIGSKPGEISVLFRRSETPAFDGSLLLQLRNVPIRDYGNDPLHGRLQRSLVPLLKERLAEAVPEYMIPSAFVIMDAFPLTPNGKVNRKALPAPERERSAEQEYVAPQTPMEEQLAAIWADILGVTQIGVKDDFFALGGHSLLATQLISRIRDAFEVKVPLMALFNQPTVAGLAQSIEGLDAGNTIHIIEKHDGTVDAPLSYSQQRLWFIDQMDPGNAVYNLPWPIRIKGALDIDALHSALNRIIERHESLRTVFRAIAGKPAQHIQDRLTLPLPLHDMSGDENTDIVSYVRDIAQHRFDLSAGPLLTAQLIRLSDEEHILMIVMHHIVADMWSGEVILRELSALYNAAVKNEDAGLNELNIQYTDYAIWEQSEQRSDLLQTQLNYWKDKLASAPPLLELPTDHPRPPVQTFNGGFEQCLLPEELLTEIKQLSSTNSSTLFMTLVAAFQVLLYRYSGQNDISVGTPIAGRQHTGLEDLIGVFINTLVIRSDLSDTPSFSEFVQQIRTTALEAYENQDIPFEKIVEELKPERNQSYTPLFQVLISLQNPPPDTDLFDGLNMESVDFGYADAKFDLTLVLTEFNSELQVRLDYNRDIFLSSSIQKMLEHFEILLKSIVANPDTSVSELQMLSEPELDKLLREWNSTNFAYPSGQTMHGLLERQADLRPNETAIYFQGSELSYAELNRRTNKLAQRLQSLGVESETLVAVCIERCPEMIIGMIAIQKAGGAYVPVDPNYPPQRVSFMLEDSEAPVVLTSTRQIGNMPDTGAELVCLDTFDWGLSEEHHQNPCFEAAEDQLGYVIYTSGSTGKPKGVEIEHRNAVALINWAGAVFSPEEFSGVLASTSICFDLSVFEIYGPLANGGRVVLVDDALALANVPADADVRLINTVPSAITELVRMRAIPESVITVNLAGEPLSTALVNDIYAVGTVKQVNDLYGPSEDTTYSTWTARLPDAPPTIGRPIYNTQAYLLDQNQQPVPIGVPGELYLGGAGVTRGYRNRPELTAEKYLQDRFSNRENAYLYRTGDLVRYQKDGNLEFIGRVDNQIKLRGFRIELGEIEAALSKLSKIEQAVVIVHGEHTSDKKLVAYVASDGSTELDIRELKNELKAQLPGHMVPGVFVAMDALPLMPNGKIDRAALPDPEIDLSVGGTFIAPRTPAEEILCEIIGNVLSLRQVGINDDFFELGGHSLLAAQLVARIRDTLNVDLQLRDLFDSPTAADIAVLVDKLAGKAPSAPIESCDRSQPLPLSFAQQRLWFLDQLESGDPVYNMPWAMRLQGPLDPAALQTAIDALSDRHEVLRTRFVAPDGVAIQVIDTEIDTAIQYHDASALSEQELREQVSLLGQQAFDLTKAPLFKTHLLKVADQEHMLVMNMHHIISDGWSLNVLFREIITLYDRSRQQLSIELPPLPIHYADFANWQVNWLRSDELQLQLDYWRDRLRGAPSMLELPIDYSRGTVQTHVGNHISGEMPAELIGKLKALAATNGSTLFMVLLAGFDVLLSRYSNQNDILVGTPVAGRKRTELESLVGFFVNTLVLRADLSDNPRFTDLIQQVKKTALEAYDNQDLPFERLVDEVQPTRDMSRSPLFQVMFVLQNQPWSGEHFDELSASSFDIDYGTAKFDLTFSLQEVDDQLRVYVEYNTDLFAEETVQQMQRHYQQVLEAAVAMPDSRISELTLLLPAELNKQLIEWNPSPSNYPRESTVHQLFAVMADAQPNATALSFIDERISYSELNERANQLAYHLIAQGVEPEMLVGICLQRSVDIVVAILAVFKSGGAYVPLDPDYPTDRIDYMLRDSGVKILISHSDVVDSLPSHSTNVISLDTDAPSIATQPKQNPDERCTPQSLAYVIYTSGSTGNPKGVMLQHQGVCNLITAQADTFGLSSQDRMLQFASMSFDASIFEIVMGLGVGAELVLAPKDDLLPGEALLNLLRSREVSAVTLPPSVLLQLPESELPKLKLITVAGEACPQEIVDRWAPGRRFFNLYGPTEATVWASFEECEPGRSPTIGKAIPNAKVYILNEFQQPVPAGVSGELCLGGAGLARGYLNRPELTAEKFITHPYIEGERLYRTGDLVRFNRDGNLEFLGRIDHQVKVRGFRIELGEIEFALAAHPSVLECVVLAQGDKISDKSLVAHLVPDGAQPSLGELRSWLQQTLPDYMVPASFVVLDAFPLTPNGKVDRKALPKSDSGRLKVESEYVAPRNRNEEVLATIWEALLGTEQVGVHDNFFELGGDSILSIQIIARAAQADLRISPKQIFQHQTIAELAAAIELDSPPVVAEQGRVLGSVPLTPIQSWFLNKNLAAPQHFNQSMLLDASEPLDPIILEQALHLLTEQHDALRLRCNSDNGIWQQYIGPFEDTQLLIDVDNNSDEKTLSGIQQMLNIEDGPLLKAALINQPHGYPQLLIVINHLAVDWVSWPILLADLELAYTKLNQGKPVAFPRKTTSFKAWSETLTAYAATDEITAEWDYWKSLPWEEVKTLPLDHPEGSNLGMHSRLHGLSLSQSDTKQLLQLAATSYRANTADLLLSATAKAVAEWTGGRAALIDLEGHGREDIFDDVDLSRTVGWFTTIYPAVLKIPADSSIAGVLNAVKHQLHEIPNRGLGYGVARHLVPGNIDDGTPLTAEISFNYLGQIDQATSGSSLFTPAMGPRGLEFGPDNQRLHKLDINCMISEGCLYLNLGYSDQIFDEATIAQFSAVIERELHALIAATDSDTAAASTALDFPLANIDQPTLDNLLEVRADIEDIYPLTPLQQGMLFHSLLDRDVDVYFASFSWLLEGDINTEKFCEAWSLVVNRHSSLRTAIHWQGLKDPLQVVYRKVDVPITLDNWSALNDAEQAARLNTLLDNDRSRAFDLNSAPLTRVTLVQLNDNSYRMVWSFHHIVMDGWSVPLVVQQVFAAYEALNSGAAPVLSHNRPFRDYIEWLQAQDQAGAQAFWQDSLRGFIAPTPLPAAVPQDAIQNPLPDYQEMVVQLPLEFGQILKDFAKHHRLTVNSITQGAWGLLLSRYSGENDVVFGATTAGRPATLSGIESMIGLFLNTLPVRIGVEPETNLIEWLQGIQNHQLNIQQYEYASLVDIQGWSDVPRGQPLFETLLAFENYPDIESLGNVEGSIQVKHSRGFDSTNFPLTLNVAMMDTLYLRFVYNRNVFPESSMQLLADHLTTLLQSIPENPGRSIAELNMLTTPELYQLQEWNRTTRDYPASMTLVNLMQGQLSKTPDAPAISYESETLSYAELDRRSNQLANYLVDLGVGRDALVGVCMERSIEMVVSLLAIVKAGGAYVPLDPDYPEQRLLNMTEDASLKCILSQQRRQTVVAGIDAKRINIEDINDALVRYPTTLPDVEILPGQLAYVIFTSGSTGRPKGVMNEHRGICNRLMWMQDEYQLSNDDRVLQKTPYSFDVSVWEFFWPLISGAELVIAKPGGHRDSGYLAQIICEREITTLHFVPSMLQVFLQDSKSAACSSMKRVICSGEALPYDLQLRFFKQFETTELHNLYGPTEAAIDVTYWACARHSSDRSVPIGRPVANTQLHIVDSEGRQTPIGVPGELWISGAQVARGYVNRPELTAERFIDDPFIPGNRVYRTGDLVKYRQDGSVEFLGRIDHQVKLRGFRIELGEIETVLTNLTEIEQASVLLREDTPGLQQLVAYLVPAAGQTVDTAAITTQLGLQLPDYMIPSVWMTLDTMPLSASGKLERKALPVPERLEMKTEYIAPRDELEAGLAEIWCDLLEAEQIGVDDDFFALGGHSLVAMRIVTRARDRLNVDIPLDALFLAPTIAKLAETVNKSRDTGSDKPKIKKADRSTRTRRKR